MYVEESTQSTDMVDNHEMSCLLYEDGCCVVLYAPFLHAG